MKTLLAFVATGVVVICVMVPIDSDDWRDYLAAVIVGVVLGGLANVLYLLWRWAL